jgi:sigma-B regulation protein RsbU (phosphoserine phosphatase)
MWVLLIDDDPTSLLYLSAVLRKQGREVVTATNGRDGFDILLERQGALVICDWNMPELTGPELCRKIRDAELPHYVYLILLTARGDKGSFLAGMDAGADDFLVKPVDPQELEAKVRAGERVLRLEQDLDERNSALNQLNSELSLAYETMKKDVVTAAAIQKSFLPEPYDGADAKLDWLFIPSSLLAGDMLGYFPLDQSHFAFFQIDVSGHGVSSALISFATSKLLWPERRRSDFTSRQALPGANGAAPVISPASVIGELNRRFCKEPESDNYFLTMVYGVFDIDNGCIQLSSAGHPPPLLWRRSDRAFVETRVRGVPVGVVDGTEYECETLSVVPGDRLIIYTDGIVECPNPAGEFFGEDRFRELLQDTSDFSLAEVKDAVSEELRVWRCCDLFPDDISLLILET